MLKLCKTFYYKHLPEFPRSTFDLENFCKYLNLENGFGRKSFLLCFYQVFLPRHFGLIFQHLILDFFHGYFATENGSYSQVTAMERITSCHHIPREEHLQKEERKKKAVMFFFFFATLIKNDNFDDKMPKMCSQDRFVICVKMYQNKSYKTVHYVCLNLWL